MKQGEDMKSDKQVIVVNPAVYPLEAVYAACYSLLDRAYFHLDEDSKGRVLVRFAAKASSQTRPPGPLAEEFLDELLHHGLRYKLTVSNQKIREHIITQALVSAQPQAAATAVGGQTQGPAPQAGAVRNKELEAEIEKLLAQVEKGGGDDPLEIAVPWEQKHASPGTAQKKEAADEKAHDA